MRSKTAAALVVAVLLTGCPPSEKSEKGGSSGPAATCRKLFEQCRLSGGALGVCNETPCAPGQPGPCLKCVSQH